MSSNCQKQAERKRKKHVESETTVDASQKNGKIILCKAVF